MQKNPPFSPSAYEGFRPPHCSLLSSTFKLPSVNLLASRQRQGRRALSPFSSRADAFSCRHPPPPLFFFPKRWTPGIKAWFMPLLPAPPSRPFRRNLPFFSSLSNLSQEALGSLGAKSPPRQLHDLKIPHFSSFSQLRSLIVHRQRYPMLTPRPIFSPRSTPISAGQRIAPPAFQA